MTAGPNPECQRQLWLNLSLQRLLLMPALLALGALAVVVSKPQALAASLSLAASVVGVLLVLVVGTRAAGQTVTDEMTDQTWDQQRMSALSPWALTWGKLLGGTAYAWYGGVLCALVAVPLGWVADPGSPMGRLALLVVLVGLGLHALALALALHLSQSASAATRRTGLWPLLVVLAWVGMPLGQQGAPVAWWGGLHDPLAFGLASAAVFAACAWATAWRCMAQALAVRLLPWGWPALAVVVGLYLAGFHPAADATAGLSGVGLVAGAMTYAALLTEPQSRPRWARMVVAVQQQRWPAALWPLPLWAASAALVWLVALLLSVWPLSPGAGLPGGPLAALSEQPLAAAGLMTRDCAWALFFAFSGGSRTPVLNFLLWMLVWYVLLPLVAAGLGGEAAMALVLPIGTAQGWATPGLSAGVAAVHAAVAVAALVWRWRQTAVPDTPGSR